METTTLWHIGSIGETLILAFHLPDTTELQWKPGVSSWRPRARAKELSTYPDFDPTPQGGSREYTPLARQGMQETAENGRLWWLCQDEMNPSVTLYAPLHPRLWPECRFSVDNPAPLATIGDDGRHPRQT